MENVELKCELSDPGLARTLLLRIGAHEVATLRQTDTYYRVASGRLKRRETTMLEPDGPVEEEAEWIHYHRADEARARSSRYAVYSDAEARERFGEGALAVWVVVRKVRRVSMLGATRVHLDEVEDLGRFIEFESVVTKSNPAAQAGEAVARLRAALAPVIGEAVGASYSDLLASALENHPLPRG